MSVLRVYLLFILTIPFLLPQGDNKSESGAIEYSLSTNPKTDNSIPVDSVSVYSALLLETLTSEDYSAGEKYIYGLKSALAGLDSIEYNSETVSDALYYIGFYYLSRSNHKEATVFFTRSLNVRQLINITDIRSARILSNLGLSQYKSEEYLEAEKSLKEALSLEEEIIGGDHPDLVSNLVNLSSVLIQLSDNDGALEVARKALRICESNPGITPQNDMASLYQSIGIAYTKKLDYTRAIVYIEKARDIVDKLGSPRDEDYALLLNNLANSYWGLGDYDAARRLFFMVLRDFTPEILPDYFVIQNNYALLLHRRGDIIAAQATWNDLLGKLRKRSEGKDQIYYQVLSNYATLLSTIPGSGDTALALCREAVKAASDGEFGMGYSAGIYLNYATVLKNLGDTPSAIEVLSEFEKRMLPELSSGNESTFLFTDQGKALQVYKMWHGFLITEWREKRDTEHLIKAADLSEKIVSLIELVRMELGEEESRVMFGERSSSSYLDAVEVLSELYFVTGDLAYSQKAFDFSERGRVASLLAATRELQATALHVPVSVSEKLAETQREIAFLKANLSEEMMKAEPDEIIISSLRSAVFSNVKARDSIMVVIEKKYPGYYQLKYRQSSISAEELVASMGRKTSYVSFLMGDSILYAFIVNREHHRLIRTPFDSTFQVALKEFRTAIISIPSVVNARSSMEQYCSSGAVLYEKLIEPVKPFINGKKLIISTDNILSYIPFETIVSSVEIDDRLTYRDLPYLMNEYEISYTYSANILMESGSGGRGFRNRSASFAPMYTENLRRDSLMQTRQGDEDYLMPLPFSLEEALSVADICNGKLFLNSDAVESNFKAVAREYPVIHLAMHTLINDNDPLYSKMIFSPELNITEDGMLNTYELYGLTIPAKMVVLSSCNTGTGILAGGEGVMSLARGFIYAGSKSVVMSLWEVEDRSGTGIVRGFFNNLRIGMTKSGALRKARIDYLKVASQQRSHPYYWSTLVIIGDNSPIYTNLVWVAFLAAIVLLAASLGYIYLRYRSTSR